MQPLIIDSDLETFLGNIASLDGLPSATAILDAAGELVYQNRAFASLNTSLRDAEQQRHARNSLMECVSVADWLAASLPSTSIERLSTTFFYAKNISVELSLLSTPIKDSNNRLLGRLLSIGEESIEFNSRHLAKLQEANRSFKNRIITLDQERNKNEKLIRMLLRKPW